ncbi:MAG: RNA chaperone Hfq [Selenomonadaceae bacterium]|nr:RNA chaperone Hfq [Selenomonadaceae bacterium]
MVVKNSNLQDNFLARVRKENIPVSIHLMNGFQLKGQVKGFDNFTVVIEAVGREQLIYKHAISTISPVKPLGGNWLNGATEEKVGGEA